MSEMQKPSRISPESIEHKVRILGEALLPEMVVVGSAAVHAALRDVARQPHDIDLAVSEQAFHYLQAQPGWHTKTGPEGTNVRNDNFDVTVNWAGQRFEDLIARSWQTSTGVHFANLADVYANKQHRNTEKDIQDATAIRNRLEDAAEPPLPIHIMPDEIQRVKNILPEWLHDHPDASAAIWIAANGLMNVFIKYGHPNIRRANQIIGTLELPEYQVAATYHNGFHLESDMKTAMGHLAAINAPASDYLLTLMAVPYADMRYGNGRKSNHPDGKNFDEWLSAHTLKAHARMAGFSENEAERGKAAILGTTFNEQTKVQEGVRNPDPLVRTITGVDFHGLSQPSAVIESMDLAVEDNMSARCSPERILGKVLVEMGVRISRTEQALAVIDEHPDAHPADNPNQTILQAHAERLRGSARLLDPSTGIYTSPHDWKFDRPDMRSQHAALLREVSARLVSENKSKRITATQAYEIAHAHARKLATAA